MLNDQKPIPWYIIAAVGGVSGVIVAPVFAYLLALIYEWAFLYPFDLMCTIIPAIIIGALGALIATRIAGKRGSSIAPWVVAFVGGVLFSLVTFFLGWFIPNQILVLIYPG